MHWSILYQIYHQALVVVFYTRYTIRDRLYCSSSIVLLQFNESLLTTSIYLPTMGLQSCHSSPLQVQFTSWQSALHNMQFQFFFTWGSCEDIKDMYLSISLYLCISVSLSSQWLTLYTLYVWQGRNLFPVFPCHHLAGNIVATLSDYRLSPLLTFRVNNLLCRDHQRPLVFPKTYQFGRGTSTPPANHYTKTLPAGLFPVTKINTNTYWLMESLEMPNPDWRLEKKSTAER